MLDYPGSVDPDQNSKRQKNPQKKRNKLDGLSRWLKAFFQAWPSFIEALEEKKYIAIYDPKM